MLFTLEALPARYGDALLLHYGPAQSPNLIVIDGGTAGVYRSALKPRLQALRQARVADPEGSLPVRMVMVSHIDDDHIRGILDLTHELVEDLEMRRPSPFSIETVWHNSFDDVLGNEAEELAASLREGVTPAGVDGTFTVRAGLQLSSHGALVMASIQQGRQLRQNAERLGIPSNHPFGGLIVAREDGLETVPLEQTPEGLRFSIIGPRCSQVLALQRDWDRHLRKLKEKGSREAEQLAAEFVDSSVFNLSSLVVLAEAGGRRMLLTGDARGDFILEGLAAAGLLDADGKIHVDLLKLPHHGSNRNVAPEFFERVTADHYVVSSDGDKFRNPDLPTLKWLTDARVGARCTLWFTYPAGGFAPMFPWPEVDALLTQARERNPGLEVRFRDPDAPSISVNLGSEPLAD